MSRIKLDLHPIYNRGDAIDAELERVVAEAERKRIRTVEIIPGKGSGQLKKRVLKFLERPDVKARYHRIDKDSKNHGRLFVYFRF
ncbi:MAG TPA: Smr/MutS family protein [Gammaproteobacteria bacterium]|nr:Smr/MutS family protein [Gammaproteobacteria bacterium]